MTSGGGRVRCETNRKIKIGRKGSEADVSVSASIEGGRSGVLRFEGRVSKPEGDSSEDRVLEVR